MWNIKFCFTVFTPFFKFVSSEASSGFVVELLKNRIVFLENELKPVPKGRIISHVITFLTLFAPFISESCVKIKINLNFETTQRSVKLKI